MSGTVAGVSAERVDAALAALAELTSVDDIGEFIGEQRTDDGAWTLEFRARMLGYPGWRWTVSVAELDGESPSVLEAELLPGPGSLVAPEWVPWSVRLEEYRAAQAAARRAGDGGAEAAVAGVDLVSDDELDELDDLDDDAELDDADELDDLDDESDDDILDGGILDDFDEDDLDIERDDHGIDLGDDEDDDDADDILDPADLS